MGNNSNCEKNGSEDLFSTKFIRNWWYVAMGVILAFLIMQCCFSNELCMSKTPPYIGYIVLIVLILYPLYNSITAFGINVKKGIEKLEGQITNLNQEVKYKNKIIVKNTGAKNKIKIVKERKPDDEGLSKLKQTMVELEPDLWSLEPQSLKDTFENKLKEIASIYFDNYPFEYIEEEDLADDILEDLVDSDVIDQSQSDIFSKIIDFCDGWLITKSIAKEQEAALRSAVKEGYKIIEEL